MGSHWSRYCGGVTERQGMALDRMARKHGIGDGMDLLMRLTGCSRSKVGKMDRASLRPYLDDAFERYSGGPSPEQPTAPDPLTAAVEAGLARVNGEAVAVPVFDPDAVRGQLREWLAAQATLRGCTVDMVLTAVRPLVAGETPHGIEG